MMLISPGSRIVSIALFGLVALAAACGPSVGAGGVTVGATCTADNQCERTCLQNNDHYPGGICTIRCSSDAQCPAGTLCVDDAGGTCMVSCANNEQCAGFGRGFVCDAEDRKGTPGGTLVCRVP